MTTRYTLSLIALAIAFGLAGDTASAAVLDSASFNHLYNGDVVPVPNYNQQGGFNTAPSTDGNIMSYRVPGSGGYFEATNWTGINSATGYTIEMRVKILDDAAESTHGAIAVYFGDGSAGDVLSVGKNNTKAGVGAVTIDTNSNTDAFHTFRVTVLQDGGGPGNPTINFYRDGSLINTWPNGGNYASNVLIFGSAGSLFGGPTVQVDYFRWDTTGAWEPPVIPEPSSLALIGAAGLLWMRRR